MSMAIVEIVRRLRNYYTTGGVEKLSPEEALEEIISHHREERVRIANYVERSQKMDNMALARDIRAGKYVA